VGYARAATFHGKSGDPTQTRATVIACGHCNDYRKEFGYTLMKAERVENSRRTACRNCGGAELLVYSG